MLLYFLSLVVGGARECAASQVAFCSGKFQRRWMRQLILLHSDTRLGSSHTAEVVVSPTSRRTPG